MYALLEYLTNSASYLSCTIYCTMKHNTSFNRNDLIDRNDLTCIEMTSLVLHEITSLVLMAFENLASLPLVIAS